MQSKLKEDVMQYSEREYISKKGNPYLESSTFGKCKIIPASEFRYQMRCNECFCSCVTVRQSSFRFFVDTETVEYFAVRKAIKKAEKEGVL